MTEYNKVMATINIEDYPELKEDLEDLCEDDLLYIQEDGVDKYVLMPMSVFETAESIMETINNQPQTMIKVISNNGDVNPELTYDEYEKIKKQLIKTLDETFKPKADKLN